MSATAEITSWKGIDPRVLADFGVSEGVVGFRVPYFDREGTLYRVKLFGFDGDAPGRDVKAVRWLRERKPQIPYGVWRLATADPRAVILTEGESDTWALAEAFPRIAAIGIPGASSWKSEWAPLLERFERVYLSFDGDAPGRDLSDRVWADLDDARVRYLRLPDGADTRSILQQLGPKAYRVLLRAAEVNRDIRHAFTNAREPLSEAEGVRDHWESVAAA